MPIYDLAYFDIRICVGLWSVCCRFVIGLSSGLWSAVGYDSSSVLMIVFQSVSCRLSIGLKSGDSIPNLTQNDPDMNPTGFTVCSATLSVADSWPIHWKFCDFCRFRVGLAGVTGVSGSEARCCKSTASSVHMAVMAVVVSKITSDSTLCSTYCWGYYQTDYQRSALLNHRWSISIGPFYKHGLTLIRTWIK